ncbi:MAG: ABC transporter ATP-binding protein [Sulfuricellaceae bacterium]
MPPPTLSAKHLGRDFASRHAAIDIAIELAQGEVLGLLGQNGAGKSTVMQMLAGVLAPTRGFVEICGVDLAMDAKAAKMHLGYLPEQPPLYTDMSVDDYLLFAAQLRRIPKPAAAAARAKARCGLNDAGQRLIAHLSKGLRQRVGIAQAIVHEPRVMILDEPTAGLDPVQIREVRKLIRELGDQSSVILSTHILEEAETLCDRIHILRDGKIVFSGRGAELAAQHGAELAFLHLSGEEKA